MDAIRNEIHDRDNVLYNYTIPIMIPTLECILKRNEMTKYKNSTCYIFFKIKGQPFPYITTKEYNMIFNVFIVMSNIYKRYKPKGMKSFKLFFVLKQILIMLDIWRTSKLYTRTAMKRVPQTANWTLRNTCRIQKMRNIWTMQNNLILRKTRSSGIPQFC